jgi:hypothetical protein
LAEFVDSVTQIGPELSGKRLELLKEVVPKLRRNTVLSNPGNTVAVLSLQRTRTAAKILDLMCASRANSVGHFRSLSKSYPTDSFCCSIDPQGTVRTRTQGRGAR